MKFILVEVKRHIYGKNAQYVQTEKLFYSIVRNPKGKREKEKSLKKERNGERERKRETKRNGEREREREGKKRESERERK